MNIVYEINYNLIEKDEWSNKNPIFGSNGQIKVLSSYGRTNSGLRYYLVSCSTCSKDKNLFGKGLFISTKESLTCGNLPCGCAPKPKWNKDQYHTLCKRKAESLGYTFLGFEGSSWNNQKTRLNLLCKIHGKWNTNSISNLINHSKGCPRCVANNKKPDEEMIDSFFASGAFHPDTKFWRSDRVTSQGARNYWNMYCPDCQTTSESFTGSLKNGRRPCDCSPMRQRECYINLIKKGDEVVAIKFGIANNSKNRVKIQNRYSLYTVENFEVYLFDDKKSCLDAEKSCKKRLECQLLCRNEMFDGYTETTSPDNLNKIREIYKSHGGVIV